MTLRRFILAAVLAVIPLWALADYTIKDGNGNFQTVMAFICQTSKICPGHVIVDSSGNEKATVTNPLVGNITQFGSTAINTGTGASGTGTPRVTVSNDSNVIPWDGTTPVNVATGNNAPTVGQAALVVAQSPNGDPCQTPAVTKLSKPVSVTSATTTQLVAISGSTSIYVCGFSLSMPPSITSAATFAFEYGTGSNCGTGTTTLTGTIGNQNGALAAGPPVPYTGGGSIGTEFSTPSAQALCVVTTGTNLDLQGYVTYVQR